LPNSSSITAKIFGIYWIGYDIPRHQYDYNYKNLKILLERNGFIIEKKSYFLNSSISSLRLWSKIFLKVGVNNFFEPIWEFLSLMSMLFYRKDVLSLKIKKINNFQFGKEIKAMQ